MGKFLLSNTVSHWLVRRGFSKSWPIKFLVAMTSVMTSRARAYLAKILIEIKIFFQSHVLDDSFGFVVNSVYG